MPVIGHADPPGGLYWRSVRPAPHWAGPVHPGAGVYYYAGRYGIVLADTGNREQPLGFIVKHLKGLHTKLLEYSLSYLGSNAFNLAGGEVGNNPFFCSVKLPRYSSLLQIGHRALGFYSNAHLADSADC